MNQENAIIKNKSFQLFLAVVFFAFLPLVSLAQTDPTTQVKIPNDSQASPQARCDFFQSQFDYTSSSTAVGSGNVITNGGLVKICSPGQLIIKFINVGMGFAGAVAVVFLMLGGYFYLMAAGNEEMSEKGRKILTNSIIGLVIIILSVAIVRVVSSTLNANLGNTAGSATSGSPTTDATAQPTNNPTSQSNPVTTLDDSGVFSVNVTPSVPTVNTTFLVKISFNGSDAQFKQIPCSPSLDVSLIDSLDHDTIGPVSATLDKTSGATARFTAHGTTGSYRVNATLCSVALSSLLANPIPIGYVAGSVSNSPN